MKANFNLITMFMVFVIFIDANEVTYEFDLTIQENKAKAKDFLKYLKELYFDIDDSVTGIVEWAEETSTHSEELFGKAYYVGSKYESILKTQMLNPASRLRIILNGYV